jgi:Domain of unknown function (DUF4157)
MALQSLADKKPNHDSGLAPVQNALQSRPFAPQAQSEQAQTLPDLQTQIENAQRFGHHLGKNYSLSSRPSSPALIQPKLTIGAPGDKYEQEADRVAQQVVQRLNAPPVGRARPEQALQREAQPEEDEELQMKPNVLQREEMPEGDEELQMKPMQMRGHAMGRGEASTDLESAINGAKGGGQSLDAGLQRTMGQAMGANFSGVRVHTDAQADQLNRSIQAKAFTTGQDVFFRQGEYNPGSQSGQELIAHELTHVVQQTGALQRKCTACQEEDQVMRQEEESSSSTSSVSNASQSFPPLIQPKLIIGAPGDQYEQEADRVAQQVVQRLNTPPVGRARPEQAVQRETQLEEDEELQMKPLVDQIQRENLPEEEEERKKKTAEDAAPKADTSSTSTDTPQADAGSGADATTTTSTTTQPVAAPTTVTPGGHTPAPPGMASCPDAPLRNIVVVGCTATPTSLPPAAEKAVLPPPNPGRFGSDADRAKFAKQLAQCRAAREVKEEIEKRFLGDVAMAKKRASEEAKADTEATIKAATEDLDPKDKGAISRAKAQAAADAKKTAAKKIAAAQTAVKHQDVTIVTAELATKYEDDLAADYDDTIKGALARFGGGWLGAMQKKLESERKRIAKEKSAKPKVVKGESPPPAKSADEISAEVEAEMVQVRCDRQEWARNQMEGISYAWAVGRREQVDFRTLPQTAAYLKDFKPAYDVATTDRVEIPASIQPESKARQGVAPELADFLSQLAADPNTPSFTASNRPGHGGGSWVGKGFSTDLSIKAPQDRRGFWQHSIAVRFLLALDATAKALGARWRVLYDDFGVAQEVNQSTGSRNVEFMGESGGGKLNWHGPDPLILHFHLDLEIPQKKPTTGNQP